MFIQMVKAALYVLAILFVFTQIFQPLLTDKKFFWFFRSDKDKNEKEYSDLNELETKAEEAATKAKDLNLNLKNE